MLLRELKEKRCLWEWSVSKGIPYPYEDLFNVGQGKGLRRDGTVLKVRETDGDGRLKC